MCLFHLKTTQRLAKFTIFLTKNLNTRSVDMCTIIRADLVSPVNQLKAFGYLHSPIKLFYLCSDILHSTPLVCLEEANPHVSLS